MFQNVAYRVAETVELLLDHDADTKATRWSGRTAAHHVASYGSVSIMEILLGYGADIHFNSNLWSYAHQDTQSHD